VPTIPFLRIQMRSRRAGARPGSLSLSLSLSLSRALLARDREEEPTKRVITVWKREVQRGEWKIRSQAHGYTALLVNTMLRKHHGAVQRGHDVSILSSPREVSLEGPRGTRCSSPPLFSPPPFRRSSFSHRFPSAALCSPDRAALFAKACRTLRERGTTHRASQITPLSKSPDLQASVYTVYNVATTVHSLRDSFPSVLYSCIPVLVSVSASLSFASPGTPEFSSFVLSRVHSLFWDVALFFCISFIDNVHWLLFSFCSRDPFYSCFIATFSKR